MIENEEFLLPELIELGFARDEALQIKQEALPVMEANGLFEKFKRNFRWKKL